MAQIPAAYTLPTLLTLPRELRDQIYDYVLQDIEPFNVIIPHPRSKGDTKFFVSYPPAEMPDAERIPRIPHELKWLMANKQICEEGIAQLQHKAMWTLTDDATISQALEAMGGVPSVYRERFKDRLIMPNEARNLVVQVPVRLSVHLELDRRGNPVGSINMTGAGTILRLFSQRPKSQKLRTLSITLYTPRAEWGSYCTPVRYKITGLSPLDAPSLCKMEFRLTSHAEDARYPDQSSTPVFRKALNELGMALIGGEGDMTNSTINVGSVSVDVLTYTRKKTYMWEINNHGWARYIVRECVLACNKRAEPVLSLEVNKRSGGTLQN